MLYHMNDANDRLPTLDWLTLPILETALKHPNTCFSLGFYPRIRILQIPQNLLVQTFKALIFPSTQWPPSPRSPQVLLASSDSEEARKAKSVASDLPKNPKKRKVAAPLKNQKPRKMEDAQWKSMRFREMFDIFI